VHSVGDLDTIKSSREVAGVHYKPKTLADMANGLSALVNDYRLKGKYVSFHVDDLYRALRSQETLSPYLEKLVIEAGKNDVNILIENSTARTDGYVPPETYNLQSMVKTFGALMEKHDNFGFCVDLSHSMEDDFKGFDLIVTAYDFNRNSPELSEVMFSNGEREKYEDIIFAINHAKTIHFSRAHEGKVTDGALIKLAAKLRVPHQRVAQLYNLLNAHLTGSSDPKFWEVVTGLLTNLGFKGVYVVESFASRQPLSFINDVHGLINA